MTKKRLLLVEDDGAALGAAEALKEVYDYDVFWTPNDWSYVSSWLSEDPGAENFYALIFDLRVPAYRLDVYDDIPYNENDDISPVLYFIEHFIRPNPRYSMLLDKIILFSAFFDEIRNKYKIKMGNSLEDDFKLLINKNEGGSLSKLLEKLNEFN